jgi:quinolinate synthase
LCTRSPFPQRRLRRLRAARLQSAGAVTACKEEPVADSKLFEAIMTLKHKRRENKDKVLYPASNRTVCPNMKKTTLEKVLRSLQTLRHEVRVSEDIRERALQAVDKMLAVKES